MNIQQFQYILAVVDLKNFEAAAEKCFVTQPTLSTMIGRFEDEIGVKIFNRKTKPVSITPDGQHIIQRLRIISSEIETLNSVVQELKGEEVGELKIGIIPTIAPYLLPLFLKPFAELFPKVNISVQEMTTPQIQEALRARNLDIGILAIPINDDDLEEFPLYSEPFLVYDCRDGKHPTSISIDRLDYSNLWLLQEGHCLRAQVHQICELSNQHPKTKVNFQFESGSMGSLLRFTKANKGITIIPYLAAEDFSEEEKKYLVHFEQPTPVRSVGLLTHKYFSKRKLKRALIDVVKASVNDLIPLVEEQQIVDPLP